MQYFHQYLQQQHLYWRKSELRNRLKSCNGNKNGCGRYYGLGYGVHNKCSKRAQCNRKEKLDFLILSGVATGLSWLCYYKALKDGSVSVVVPIDKLSVVITMVFAAIFLHEQFTAKSIIGLILISVGTLLMVI